MKRAWLAAALLVLPTATARADRIHLENGNVFDDVVLVSETSDRVRFLVGSGEMSLPASWIAKVEKAPGALEQYLERSGELATLDEPSAEAYLALARWSRLQGLDHGFREALMTAAQLEPDLRALAPLMASVGYSRDPAQGFWAPEPRSDAVLERDRPASSARSTGVARGSTPESEVEIAAGLTRAIETLAQAELERTRARRVSRPIRSVGHAYPLVAAAYASVSSGWVFPGVPLRGPDSDPADPVIRRPANPNAKALLARPPGSLLPVSAYRH